MENIFPDGDKISKMMNERIVLIVLTKGNASLTGARRSSVVALKTTQLD